MRLHQLLWSALAGLALFAGACGDDADSSTVSSDGPSTSTLVSTEGLWFLTTASDDGEDLDVRFGEMTMEFPGNGTVVGQAGCNTYRASIDLTDAGNWLAGDYTLTEIACDTPGLMDAEAAFMTAIAKATTISTPDADMDTLVLTGETTEMRFELMPHSADDAG